MTRISTRQLGRSGIKVSAMGLGCWPIGGQMFLDGKSDSYGEVDDNESIRAIRRALDLGVNFFDTADVYGIGHSERVLGQALEGHREEVVISTKFGYTYDERSRQITGTTASPEYVRQACEASLRRLNTDYIDLYLFHVWALPADLPAEKAALVLEALEELRSDGVIRAYGWSTDIVEQARLFAEKPSCTAIEHELNVLHDMKEMIELCEKSNLASINRMPLAMGLLTGKYTSSSRLPASDTRGAGHEWVKYFKDGRPSPEWLKKLNAVRGILTSDGRSLVQGALAWLWGRSEKTIPIPGFKTTRQIEENIAAMEFGPLSADQMRGIEEILGPRSFTY